VLVSLDGFRYDYAKRYHADHLLAIGNSGASAPEGMIPSVPTVTFPNHISIVTGLYPEHHGIVSNNFWDPERKQRYTMSHSATDGTWYRAKTLWVIAEEQNVKSACMFWPTADAEILGVRPSYWKLYDGRFEDEKRVAQILEWLKLPEAERPHLLTLYFSDIDTAGHDYGPDSPELEEAVHRVDKLVGDLWAGIQATSLPVNLIVLADHGMQTVQGSIDLTKLADLSRMHVNTAGPMALITAPGAQAAQELHQRLRKFSDKITVYRRHETPASWHFSENPRIGDLVLMAKGPYIVSARRPDDAKETPSHDERGAHGFDPARFTSMRTIFFAVGPNIQRGVTLKPFENVNVFPFITKILSLPNPPNLDGSEKPLLPAYRQ
jgi:alkaline phosphatase D